MTDNTPDDLPGGDARPGRPTSCRPRSAYAATARSPVFAPGPTVLDPDTAERTRRRAAPRAGGLRADTRLRAPRPLTADAARGGPLQRLRSSVRRCSSPWRCGRAALVGIASELGYSERLGERHALGRRAATQSRPSRALRSRPGRCSSGRGSSSGATRSRGGPQPRAHVDRLHVGGRVHGRGVGNMSGVRQHVGCRLHVGRGVHVRGRVHVRRGRPRHSPRVVARSCSRCPPPGHRQASSTPSSPSSTPAWASTRGSPTAHRSSTATPVQRLAHRA